MRLRSVLPLPLGDGIRERVDSFDIDDEAKPVMAERWRHTATATTARTAVYYRPRSSGLPGLSSRQQGRPR